MKTYILDTSVFTNPDVFVQFHPDFQAAVAEFLDLAQVAQAEFYMPTSVYLELKTIKDLDGMAADFERVVRIRSPRRHNLAVPSELLYEFIEEVRHRINRGLKIAEEWLKRAGEGGIDDVGALVNKLRDRYREAMRQGIIDSKEDADLLLLTYELDGILVTADGGLRTWADKAGVGLIEPRNLKRILEGLTLSDNAQS